MTLHRLWSLEAESFSVARCGAAEPCRLQARSTAGPPSSPLFYRFLGFAGAMFALLQCICEPRGRVLRYRPTGKDCASLFEPSLSFINKGDRFPVSYFRECCLESSSWSIHLLSLGSRNTQLLPFFVAGTTPVRAIISTVL